MRADAQMFAPEARREVFRRISGVELGVGRGASAL